MYEEKRKKEREKERKKERDRIVHKKISNETIVSENIINQRLNYYIHFSSEIFPGSIDHSSLNNDFFYYYFIVIKTALPKVKYDSFQTSFEPMTLNDRSSIPSPRHFMHFV